MHRLSATFFLTISLAAVLAAQTFDSSANASLKGNYFVRQVLLNLDPNTALLNRGRSLIGTATLDGAGHYTITGTLFDSTAGSTAQSFTFTGVYAVSASGLAQMQNPLETSQVVDGGVGLGTFVGSSTETLFQDVLIMIPAGTAAVTNASLQGSYRVGTLDFPQATFGTMRDAYFSFTTTGDGNLGTLAVNGSGANLGNTPLTQSITGATYSLSGQGSGTIIFPPASSIAANQLLTGTKTLYLSADGNILLGGSATGFDLLLGIRALASGANPAIAGEYYAVGMDINNSNTASPTSDAFYGSFDGVSGGVNLWHQRLNPNNQQTFDYTFSDTVALDATGTQAKSLVHYDLGAGGKAVLIVGRGTEYTLALGVHADTFTGSGVYINPMGIVNAASYSPVTDSVAPNEIISIFGSGLASATIPAQTTPLPTTLSGVQVTVNGRPAHLFFVSPGQINALIPSNTPEPYATFQVTNNGVSSNSVTVYTNNTAPGVFTLDASGVGPAAALHSTGPVVNGSNPANPGEVIQIYTTGLGLVNPTVADGAAAPNSPLSTTVEAVAVQVTGKSGTVTFAGLAPGFTGLYQINVQVPGNASGGTQLLSIDNPDAIAQEATIAIAGTAGTSGLGSAAGPRERAEFYRPAPSRTKSAKVSSGSGGRR